LSVKSPSLFIFIYTYLHLKSNSFRRGFCNSVFLNIFPRCGVIAQIRVVNILLIHYSPVSLHSFYLTGQALDLTNYTHTWSGQVSQPPDDCSHRPHRKLNSLLWLRRWL